MYNHGFVRVAAAVPHVRVADPAFNAERTVGLARTAAEGGAALVVFPELGLSAYSIEDLFHQAALLDASSQALAEVTDASRELSCVIVVGLPVEVDQGVFNMAAVIHRGQLLGAVPKSYLPEYREYYEKRQFRAARDLTMDHIELLGQRIPCGCDLLFTARRPAELQAPCGDLRGPLGADPTQHLRRDRRRHCAREPVGQQHHDRQVRLPAPAVRRATRRARSRPTSTRRRDSASRPPMSHGMVRP